MFVLKKGAFVGMLTSLIFTMWMGFGQTVAKNYGTIVSKPLATTVVGCPAAWLNATAEAAAKAAAKAAAEPER